VWKQSLHRPDEAPATPHLTYTLPSHCYTHLITLAEEWQANGKPPNHTRPYRPSCQDAAHPVPGKPLAGRLGEAAAISRYPQIPFGGHPCMLMIIRQAVEPKHREHHQTHRSRVVDRPARESERLSPAATPSWVSLSASTLPALPTSTRRPFLPPPPANIISARNMGIIANSPSSEVGKMIAFQHRHRRRWST
jgi:hypothetical protein